MADFTKQEYHDLLKIAAHLTDEIRGALGTEERGTALVDVARAAHRAEQAHAALTFKLATMLDDGTLWGNAPLSNKIAALLDQYR